VKHRLALFTLLTAALLAGGPTAQVQKKGPGRPAAAARKVTITLVRWPYT
jgi:hypothetical protein